MIEDIQPCASAASLSLSFAPFRTERSIRGAEGGGAGDAWPGSWLGPNRPSVFDDGGRYIDALTGRRLLPGAGYSVKSGGAAPEASCDGRVASYGSPAPWSLTIVSPVRSGHRIVAARRRIVPLLPLADDIEAQWSPDGRYLFYIVTHGRGNSSSLWRVRSDGRGRQLLYTDRFGSDLSGIVSPNGRWVLLKVLVTTPASDSPQLWLIRSDGRGLRRVAAVPVGQYGDVNGEWSPRGDQLFVHEEGVALMGTAQTLASYVIRSDGADHRSLPASMSSFPVWSPDERQLAYFEVSTTTAGGASLELAAVAGGPPRTVLTAVQPPLTPGVFEIGIGVSDWQAAPGTGLRVRCRDGAPPF